MKKEAKGIGELRSATGLAARAGETVLPGETPSVAHKSPAVLNLAYSGLGLQQLVPVFRCRHANQLGEIFLQVFISAGVTLIKVGRGLLVVISEVSIAVVVILVQVGIPHKDPPPTTDGRSSFASVIAICCGLKQKIAITGLLPKFAAR